MAEFLFCLFVGNRVGFVIGQHGWARFRRGELVDASPAVFNAYGLMAAHFDQVGFYMAALTTLEHGLKAQGDQLTALREWAPNARQAFVIERIRRALVDRAAYIEALRTDKPGSFEICVDIEKRWELFKFRTAHVLAGLNAACEGRDAVLAAEDAYKAWRAAS